MGWTIELPPSEAVRRIVAGARDPEEIRAALRDAAGSGAPGWIDSLADVGIDVHQPLGDGETTLHVAAAAGHRELAERLVELGGDPSQPDTHGRSAIERASEEPLASRLRGLVGFGRAARAIHDGEPTALVAQLEIAPDLVRSRVLGETLAHVVVLWPGHRPSAAACLEVLHEHGADLSAAYDGPFGHRETPLHGAVSANDLVAATALLDLGADIDAPGAVIAGGPPLVDAVVFRQWACAHLLVLRGCRVNLPYAAALGRLDLVRQFVSDDGTVADGACDLPGWPPGASQDVALELALHLAVHGEQLAVARWLVERGAPIDWTGPTGRTTRELVEQLTSGWSQLTP